jgi:hypothetical protein
MAASVTTKEWVELGKSFRCVVDWSTGGSETTASVALPSVTGLYLFTLETIPTGTLGGTYDITLLNTEETDMLSGVGAGRSASAKEIVQAAPSAVSPGVLTFTLTGAGNSEAGRAIITWVMNI